MRKSSRSLYTFSMYSFVNDIISTSSLFEWILKLTFLKYFENEVPGVVSIFPTIARHMNLEIPRAQAMEIDGVPLIGEVSLANPTARLENKQIELEWKAMEKKGNVKIWLSTTNHFKEGSEDEYTLVGEVTLKKEKYSIDVNDMPSSFYKIVLEGSHNFVNYWIVPEEE